MQTYAKFICCSVKLIEYSFPAACLNFTENQDNFSLIIIMHWWTHISSYQKIPGSSNPMLYTK